MVESKEVVVVVGKKDGDVVVPSSVGAASLVVAASDVVSVKKVSVVDALASVDVASGDVAVASAVVVVGSAATNEPNATELNRPTHTKTATAAARRVFFSSECPLTVILSLEHGCAPTHTTARRRTRFAPTPCRKKPQFLVPLIAETPQNLLPGR